MMDLGALDEVRNLEALQLDAGLPVMGALGVRPLMAHLSGEMSLDDAIAAGKLDTRRYIKRQQTWLKRYMMSWNKVQTNKNGNFDVYFALIID